MSFLPYGGGGPIKWIVSGGVSVGLHVGLIGLLTAGVVELVGEPEFQPVRPEFQITLQELESDTLADILERLGEADSDDPLPAPELDNTTGTAIVPEDGSEALTSDEDAETIEAETGEEAVEDTTETIEAESSGTVDAEEASESVEAETGDDAIGTEDTPETVEADTGNDAIGTEDTSETVEAEIGDDAIDTEDTSETVEAETGDDAIDTEDTSETVEAETGDDAIDTEDTPETVEAETGDDAIDTEDTPETVEAETGNDAIGTEDTSETVEAETGDDTLDAEDTSETASEDPGAETLETEDSPEAVATDLGVDALPTADIADALTAEPVTDLNQDDTGTQTVGAETIDDLPTSEGIADVTPSAPETAEVETVEPDTLLSPLIDDVVTVPENDDVTVITSSLDPVIVEGGTLPVPNPDDLIGELPNEAATAVVPGEAAPILDDGVATIGTVAGTPVGEDVTSDPTGTLTAGGGEAPAIGAVNVDEIAAIGSTPVGDGVLVPDTDEPIVIAGITTTSPEQPRAGTSEEPATAPVETVPAGSVAEGSQTPETLPTETTAPEITSTSPVEEAPGSAVADDAVSGDQSGAIETVGVTAVPPKVIRRSRTPPSERDLAVGDLIQRIRVRSEEFREERGPAWDCVIALPRRAGDDGIGLALISADDSVMSKFAEEVLVRPEDADILQTRTLVDVRQCAALSYITKNNDYPATRIGMRLDTTEVGSGNRVSGVMRGVGDRNLALFLVDNNGVVQDLDRFLTQSGEFYRFDVPVTRVGRLRDTKHLLLAVASSEPLTVLKDRSGQRADDVFRDLSNALSRQPALAVVPFDVR